MKLAYYGNPILRTRCEPVGEITEEIRALAQSMMGVLEEWKGIGLSAPQVGYAIRLFVASSYFELPDGKWGISPPKVYINPQLSMHSKEEIEDSEGCLSIPGIRADVLRPLRVRIKALDLNGETFTENLEGYNARIRMHENDHINGVLFVDRLPPAQRKQLEPELRAIKKKYN